VTEILKAHPEHSQWQESFRGEAGNVDLPAFVFMRASVWPDKIRRRGNKYDHPGWHYINYPLQAPAFQMKPGQEPTNDILFGMVGAKPC